MQEQDNTIKVLENEILALQTYLRKDNLLIDGISESPNEDVSAKLRAFCKDKMGILNPEVNSFICAPQDSRTSIIQTLDDKEVWMIEGMFDINLYSFPKRWET